jgi:predicted TIM-barrel fold metal-dependent hydrolase
MPASDLAVDSHVYCLPPRWRNARARLPAAESAVRKAFYAHPDGSWVLPLSSPEAIAASMKRSAIARAALVGFPWAGAALCEESAAYVLEQARREPKRYWAVCPVQPRDAGHLAAARRWLDAGAVGLKVNAQWQGFALDDRRMDGLAKLAARRGAYLLLHIDQPTGESQASPARLLALARRHPKTRIVAAHMGGLLGLYAKLPWIGRALRNVWYDTAVSETLETVRFYAELGLSDRVVFGTDFPFNLVHDQKTVKTRLLKLGLERRALRAVLSRNYLSLVGRRA